MEQLVLLGNLKLDLDWGHSEKHEAAEHLVRKHLVGKELEEKVEQFGFELDWLDSGGLCQARLAKHLTNFAEWLKHWHQEWVHCYQYL